MDNDSSLKRKSVQLYRSIRKDIDYRNMNLLNTEEGNILISQLINSNKPFMVGRFGAVEMHLISKYMQGRKFSQKERTQALDAAGIFPNDVATLCKFCDSYIDAMRSCDVLGVWEVAGEKKAIIRYCNSVQLIPAKSIEPYYFSNPWSEKLEYKKILIIHPFVNSIKKQISRQNEIWMNSKVLPKFETIEYIQAVQSNAGNKTDFFNWFEALEFMKRQIEEKNYDIAIVGAGAYGLPLSAYIRKSGKSVIQMSGATQILFGIKGKRWDQHPVISKFYNNSWIRPDEAETPASIEKVEGGCYW